MLRNDLLNRYVSGL